MFLATNFLNVTIDNLSTVRDRLNSSNQETQKPIQAKNNTYVSLLSLGANVSTVYFAIQSTKSLFFGSTIGLLFNLGATVVSYDSALTLNSFRKNQEQYENNDLRMDSQISWMKQIAQDFKSGNLVKYTTGCILRPVYILGFGKLADIANKKAFA